MSELGFFGRLCKSIDMMFRRHVRAEDLSPEVRFVNLRKNDTYSQLCKLDIESAELYSSDRFGIYDDIDKEHWAVKFKGVSNTFAIKFTRTHVKDYMSLSKSSEVVVYVGVVENTHVSCRTDGSTLGVLVDESAAVTFTPAELYYARTDSPLYKNIIAFVRKKDDALQEKLAKSQAKRTKSIAAAIAKASKESNEGK